MEKAPVQIAYIIDNEVVDVLHTDERLGAILLSNPVVIDVTENFFNKNNQPNILIGASYDAATNTFTNPEIDARKNQMANVEGSPGSSQALGLTQSR